MCGLSTILRRVRQITRDDFTRTLGHWLLRAQELSKENPVDFGECVCGAAERAAAATKGRGEGEGFTGVGAG